MEKYSVNIYVAYGNKKKYSFEFNLPSGIGGGHLSYDLNDLNSLEEGLIEALKEEAPLKIKVFTEPKFKEQRGLTEDEMKIVKEKLPPKFNNIEFVFD